MTTKPEDSPAVPVERLRAAAQKMLDVLRERHYGRMPLEVQAAVDGLDIAICASDDHLAAIAALTKQPKERRAPVQGYSRGIPWSLHLEAYDGYCKQYGKQQALIEGGCRGGFGIDELDEYIPGWRARVDEITELHATISALQKKLQESALDLLAVNGQAIELMEQNKALQEQIKAAEIVLADLARGPQHMGYIQGIVPKQWQDFGRDACQDAMEYFAAVEARKNP